MAIKIFHTGDVHLGMNFNNYGEGLRGLLAEARFEALERMINQSNDLGADLFVVAGDLFNKIRVAKRDVERAVNILKKFNGASVLVLPGNHDYEDGVVDLWRDFEKHVDEKILILNEDRVYDLEDYDLDAVVYPAHCHSKHSQDNSLGWIKKEEFLDEDKYHIGIAHGALEGLSADIEGNYYYMEMDELESIGTDIWLIGHTHVRYPVQDEIRNHKVFNAGTPEPDGMNFRGAGSAWFISLDREGSRAEAISTGEYRFYDREFTINSQEDLDKVKVWALEGERKKKLVRLNLKGSLSKETYESLNEFYGELDRDLFYLKIEDSQLRIRIDEEIIQEEFVEGSFPYEFLKGLIDDEEALQIAYDLMRRE